MPPTLEAKIAQLTDYRSELDKWLAEAGDQLPGLARVRVLERMVQLVIECAADAGDLWLAQHKHPLGQSAAGVIQNLNRAGAVNDELASRFRQYISARNRIIHDYDRVTPEQVVQEAQGLARDVTALVEALQRPQTGRGPRPPSNP